MPSACSFFNQFKPVRGKKEANKRRYLFLLPLLPLLPLALFTEVTRMQKIECLQIRINTSFYLFINILVTLLPLLPQKK